MDLSSISASGASGIQAATLLALLNRSSSSDSDSASALDALSSDSVSISAAGLQAATNPMQADLDKLSKLISSGDTTAAKELLAQIEKKFKEHGPDAAGGSSSSSSGTAGASSGPEADFAALENALESGDTTTAQTALTKLKQGLQAMGQPPAPPSGSQSLEATLLAAYLKAAADPAATSAASSLSSGTTS
jgi:hypothetical protein